MTDLWKDAVPATLEEVLEARERRAGEQRLLREQHGCAVISFTLNLPGHFKRYPLADRGFQEGKSALLALLQSNGWHVLEQREEAGAAGCQLLLAVEADPLILKRETAGLEEMPAMGRLYDIDVIDRDGNALRREAVGYPGRRCLLCGKPVQLCAGGRSHSLEELAEAAASVLSAHYREEERR